MSLNVFSSGVNTSFSSQLNENFALSVNRVTTAVNNSSGITNTNTTYEDALSLVTPVALINGQKIFVEVYFNAFATGGNADFQLYDSTGAAQIAIRTLSASSNFTYFLSGIISIATAGSTKTVALRTRRNGATSYSVAPIFIKCSLSE